MITNWRTTRQDAELIINIAQRASAMAKAAGVEYPVLEADMDITAAHLHGCKLDLAALAGASNFDFAHDVFGIRRHIDRDTGELGDCFLPRYAAREVSNA